MLMVSFILLSGFRAQTIIHDDGSETQDILKVSSTMQGQTLLKADAEEFQKRNYVIMDYSNNNGSGFRALKTITNEGANKSSVDRIIHKTYDGILCTTYYIKYAYTPKSIEELRWGKLMPENGADLEYIVSFPAGTNVTSNSTNTDIPGSTYMWRLRNEQPVNIELQATVWHKLFIYLFLAIIVLMVFIVIVLERRRKRVMSWMQAAHLRKIELLLLCIPIFILGYMCYEYYVGTHITERSLVHVAEQQQQEEWERHEEDQQVKDDVSVDKNLQDEQNADIKEQIMEISRQLRQLNDAYANDAVSLEEAQGKAQNLRAQVADLIDKRVDLTQANQEELHQIQIHIMKVIDKIKQDKREQTALPAVETDDYDVIDNHKYPVKNRKVKQNQQQTNRIDAGQEDDSVKVDTSNKKI
ncbi:hypothetical protein CAL30_05745 [Megasphaera hutchinsoni]|uniref:Uncharacterized protein n=2 Tax=Megasphaera hutchinsoni TaxID=1588748 RepID=A0A2J8B9T0_9FIRM|nr:hypothetical protein [Veillonellaceae bacterium M2-4]PNH21544.1 hypothetical protein CAL30_05745 [Megasphaera genomosp. type_2]